jgi:hypothetical protein
MSATEREWRRRENQRRRIEPLLEMLVADTVKVELRTPEEFDQIRVGLACAICKAEDSRWPSDEASQ